MEKTGCKIICGAPTTLAVKGLMMMMSLYVYLYFCVMYRACVCMTGTCFHIPVLVVNSIQTLVIFHVRVHKA